MTVRYAVLRAPILLRDTTVFSLCENFYRIPFVNLLEESLGVFSELDTAILYAREKKQRDMLSGEDVYSPVYEVEFEDDADTDREYRYGLFVDQKVSRGKEKIIVTRRIYTPLDYYLLSKIRNVHLFDKDKDIYESINLLNWSHARQEMLVNRIETNVLNFHIEVVQRVNQILTACKGLSEEGKISHEELLDTLALVDDTLGQRLTHKEFEDRLNKLQGYIKGSHYMRFLGKLIGSLGVIILGASFITVAPLGAALAVAGVVDLAIGIGFFAFGREQRKGLCKLTAKLDDENALYFRGA